MILAAHSLVSPKDGVLMLRVSEHDGYSAVMRKIIEGLQNELGVEGEIRLTQVSRQVVYYLFGTWDGETFRKYSDDLRRVRSCTTRRNQSYARRVTFGEFL